MDEPEIKVYPLDKEIDGLTEFYGNELDGWFEKIRY